MSYKNFDPIHSFARWLAKKRFERSKRRQVFQQGFYLLIMIVAGAILALTQDKPDWIHIHAPCLAAIFFCFILFFLDL